MKYCSKCGEPMNDDDLFCPRCGAKVNPPIEEQKPMQQQEPVAVNETPKEEVKPKKVKGKAPSTFEQPPKQFLPVPLALIACSIAIWIINAVAGLTGIPKVMPLLIFMLLSGFLGVMSMIRAVKKLNRKIYFDAALSFVLFALLIVCLIIDFVFLIR